MGTYIDETGAQSCLILTGGSPSGNFMHQSRAKGMLEQLGYTGDVDALLASAEPSELTI